MAHLDLHEQEQLSKLKYFWRDWGKYVIAVLAVVFVAYISSVIWENYGASNAVQASAIFEQLNTAIKNKNTSDIYKLTDKLEQSYPKAEYAPMAAILAAKSAYDQKDLAKAATYLNWTIKNSTDKGLASLAMLRLTDVYIDQKKYDLALNTLMQDHEPSFDALFYAKRGDLHLVRGDLAKARDSYKAAIDKAGQDQNMANSIQMKLDVLGG